MQKLGCLNNMILSDLSCCPGVVTQCLLQTEGRAAPRHLLAGFPPTLENSNSFIFPQAWVFSGVCFKSAVLLHCCGNMLSAQTNCKGLCFKGILIKTPKRSQSPRNSDTYDLENFQQVKQLSPTFQVWMSSSYLGNYNDFRCVLVDMLLCL